MRIKSDQVEAIHQSIKFFFAEIKYDLFLYGSRTKDQLKGGDIDLLIVTNTEGVALFNSKHLEILVLLKKQPHIGQRRIDLKAATPDRLKTDPFLNSISDSLLALNSGTIA